MATTINKFYEINKGWKIFGTVIVVGAIIWIVYRLINKLPIIPSFSSTTVTPSGERSGVSPVAGKPCTPAQGGMGVYDSNGICQPTNVSRVYYIPVYITRQRGEHWRIPANQAQAQRIADRICALQGKIDRLGSVSEGDAQAVSAILENEGNIPSNFTNSERNGWIAELQKIINRLRRLLDEGGYMIEAPCTAVRKLEIQPVMQPIFTPITAQPVSGNPVIGVPIM